VNDCSVFGGIAFLAQAAGGVADWRDTWPFGPGYAEGWISTVLKFGMIAVLFLGIALLLRFLFGPGGWMRDKEFDAPQAGPQASDADGAAPPDSPQGAARPGPRSPGDPHA